MRPSRHYIPWSSLLVSCFCAQATALPRAGSLHLRNNTLPTIDEYRTQRADLIAEERAIRFDADRIRNATSQELKAVEIVDAIRRREQASVWYADPNKEPGMPFLWAKNTIAQTDLFKVIKKMPKGALLHAHLDAMCDASYLLKLALEYPSMHMRTASNLNSSAPFPNPIFKPVPAAEASQYANNSLPTTVDYVPNSWVSMQRLRKGFPSELGGESRFDQWIVSALTISAEDTYQTYNTTAKIWGKFTQTFIAAFGLVRYEPILRRYTEQLLISQIEDGISPVIAEDAARNLTSSQVLDLTQSVIDGIKTKLMGEGREDEFIGARTIYSATRSISYDEMVQQLNECLALKAEYPELVAGFDMAGQEEPGHPLIYFAEALLNFRAEAERRGLDIPFMFHAGETLDDGGEVDSNLYDALLLGAKRVGHGQAEHCFSRTFFSLAKHPLLMQKYRENGIAVEVCPISNELLNPGLSFDFYQAIVASNITNILSLGQLARQSLEHSSLNQTAKDDALKRWEGKWLAFIDDIVSSG